MGKNRLALTNMFFLLGRMAITMVINLYASRILLDALGVSDYGVYNVVAGMVVMISFLHYSLNGATVRFINIEFANNNFFRLNELFKNLFFVHLIIGLLIILIGEPLGLYLVYKYLNLPDNRIWAAEYVLHFSIASMFLNVIQVPYDSTIIAHQKMNILAYVSILESLLKLSACFLVLYSTWDHLVLYSFLLFSISLITRAIYQIYCKINYKETKLSFNFKFDTGILKEVSVYFGWDLIGNIAALLRTQGINILQNIFFGTIVNASMGIANVVANAISSLVANVSFALKPQIFQYYSTGDKDKSFYLVDIGARLSFYFLLLISIPFIFQTDFFLNLWLDEIPEFSTNYTRFIIFSILFGTIFDYLVIIINANGRIKTISVFGTIIYLANFIVALVLLKSGCNKYTVSIIHILTTFIMGIVNTMILTKLEPSFNLNSFWINVILRCSLVSILSFYLNYLLLKTFYLKDIYAVIIEMVITFIIILILGIKNIEKVQLFNIVRKRVKL